MRSRKQDFLALIGCDCAGRGQQTQKTRKCFFKCTAAPRLTRNCLRHGTSAIVASGRQTWPVHGRAQPNTFLLIAKDGFNGALFDLVHHATLILAASQGDSRSNESFCSNAFPLIKTSVAHRSRLQML